MRQKSDTWDEAVMITLKKIKIGIPEIIDFLKTLSLPKYGDFEAFGLYWEKKKEIFRKKERKKKPHPRKGVKKKKRIPPVKQRKKKKEKTKQNKTKQNTDNFS